MREEIVEAVQAFLTDEMARAVRAWRCEDEHTWRGVAGYFNDAWPGLLDYPDQFWGEALCHLSAVRLGEGPEEDPWN